MGAAFGVEAKQTLSSKGNLPTPGSGSGSGAGAGAGQGANGGSGGPKAPLLPHQQSGKLRLQAAAKMARGKLGKAMKSGALAKAAAAGGGGGDSGAVGVGEGRAKAKAGAMSALLKKSDAVHSNNASFAKAQVATRAFKQTAETAKEQNLESLVERVAGRDEYSWWTPECVNDSIQRARAHFKAKRTYDLTRHEFWQIFTDYTVLTVPPSSAAHAQPRFLSLSQHIFDLFAKRPEPVGDDDDEVIPRANAIEVILVLLLFCRGNPSQQLPIMFHLFDADNSGTITIAEMRAFLTTLCTASARIGLIAGVPTEEQINMIAESMFASADEDGNGDISVSEFVSWATEHVHSRKLLSVYDEVRRKTLRGAKGKAVNLKAAEEEDDGQDKESRVLGMNRVLLATSAVMKRIIASNAAMDAGTMQALRKKFQQTAAAHNRDELNCDEFTVLLQQAYPCLSDSSEVDTEDGAELCKCLFEAFDVDRSGMVDFKEFAMGLAKYMSGNWATKMQLMWEAFDENGDGDVQLTELMQVVHQGNKEFAEISEVTEVVMGKLDSDGDGNVSLEEFKECISNQPVLFKAINSLDLEAPAAELVNFKAALQQEAELAEANYHRKVANGYTGEPPPTLTGNKISQLFSTQSLAAAYDRYCGPDATMSLPAALDLVRFRKFMVEEFHAPPNLMPLVNKVFDMLDENGNGRVDRKEMFQGLSTVTTGSVEDKAEFMFRMYDADASGTIDANEIMNMVVTSQQAVNDTASTAAKLLQELDLDGNGVITYDEFQIACKERPELLQCFGQLFGSLDVQDENNQAQLRAQHVTKMLVPSVKLTVAAKKKRAFSKLKAANAFADAGRAAVSPERELGVAEHQRVNKRKGVKAMRRLSLHTASHVVGNILDALKSSQEQARRAAGVGSHQAVHSRNEIAHHQSEVARAVGHTYGTMLKDEVEHARSHLQNAIDRHDEEERHARRNYIEISNAERQEAIRQRTANLTPLPGSPTAAQRNRGAAHSQTAAAPSPSLAPAVPPKTPKRKTRRGHWADSTPSLSNSYVSVSTDSDSSGEESDFSRTGRSSGLKVETTGSVQLPAIAAAKARRGSQRAREREGRRGKKGLPHTQSMRHSSGTAGPHHHQRSGLGHAKKHGHHRLSVNASHSMSVASGLSRFLTPQAGGSTPTSLLHFQERREKEGTAAGSSPKHGRSPTSAMTVSILAAGEVSESEREQAASASEMSDHLAEMPATSTRIAAKWGDAQATATARGALRGCMSAVDLRAQARREAEAAAGLVESQGRERTASVRRRRGSREKEHRRKEKRRGESRKESRKAEAKQSSGEAVGEHAAMIEQLRQGLAFLDGIEAANSAVAAAAGPEVKTASAVERGSSTSVLASPGHQQQHQHHHHHHSRQDRKKKRQKALKSSKTAHALKSSKKSASSSFRLPPPSLLGNRGAQTAGGSKW